MWLIISIWHWPLAYDLDLRLLTLISNQDEGKKQQCPDTIFSIWPWPTTLTYNPSLPRVKVDPCAKNQGQRSNGSNRRARTNTQTYKQTNGRYQVHYLPALRSITKDEFYPTKKHSCRQEVDRALVDINSTNRQMMGALSIRYGTRMAPLLGVLPVPSAHEGRKVT